MLGTAGAGEVLRRFGAGAAMLAGVMAWSWLRILGRRRGPWVRMGDRAGVVRRVLGAVTDTESEGDEPNEYTDPMELERE